MVSAGIIVSDLNDRRSIGRIVVSVTVQCLSNSICSLGIYNRSRSGRKAIPVIDVNAASVFFDELTGSFIYSDTGKSHRYTCHSATACSKRCVISSVIFPKICIPLRIGFVLCDSVRNRRGETGRKTFSGSIIRDIFYISVYYVADSYNVFGKFFSFKFLIHRSDQKQVVIRNRDSCKTVVCSGLSVICIALFPCKIIVGRKNCFDFGDVVIFKEGSTSGLEYRRDQSLRIFLFGIRQFFCNIFYDVNILRCSHIYFCSFHFFCSCNASIQRIRDRCCPVYKNKYFLPHFL